MVVLQRNEGRRGSYLNRDCGFPLHPWHGTGRSDPPLPNEGRPRRQWSEDKESARGALGPPGRDWQDRRPDCPQGRVPDQYQCSGQCWGEPSPCSGLAASPPPNPREGGLRPPPRPEGDRRESVKHLGRVNHSVRLGSRRLWQPPLRGLRWKGLCPRSPPVTEEPGCEVPRSLLSLLRRGLPSGDY